MQLEPHKRNWEELADVDPLWAILSNASLQHGRWDINDFFLTGEREITTMMETVKRLHLHVNPDSVLDFGCGVGRLTRAFAGRFQTCYGVDISERMIENAQRLNHEFPNCHFCLNTVDNLRIFPNDSFDMIYTNLVLQHIPHREIIKSYIKDFVRTLKPDGLLVFQLPSHIPLRRRAQLRRRLYSALRFVGFSHTLLYNKFGLNPMKMSYISVEDVKATIGGAGGQVDFVETRQTPQYVSSMYFVTRHHPAS